MVISVIFIRTTQIQPEMADLSEHLIIVDLKLLREERERGADAFAPLAYLACNATVGLTERAMFISSERAMESLGYMGADAPIKHSLCVFSLEESARRIAEMLERYKSLDPTKAPASVTYMTGSEEEMRSALRLRNRLEKRITNPIFVGVSGDEYRSKHIDTLEPNLMLRDLSEQSLEKVKTYIRRHC